LAARSPLSSLSLHDALPISEAGAVDISCPFLYNDCILKIFTRSLARRDPLGSAGTQQRHRVLPLHQRAALPPGPGGALPVCGAGDRKSTRLNSSHVSISYAV